MSRWFSPYTLTLVHSHVVARPFLVLARSTLGAVGLFLVQFHLTKARGILPKRRGRTTSAGALCGCRFWTLTYDLWPMRETFLIAEHFTSANKLSQEFQTAQELTLLAIKIMLRLRSAQDGDVNAPASRLLTVRTDMTYDFNVVFMWLQCAYIHTNSISILGFVPHPSPSSPLPPPLTGAFLSTHS